MLLQTAALQSQAIFDTLYLHEFEVIALKNDFKSTCKQTEIDTLIRKEFEHYDLGELLSSFSPVFIKSYGKGSIASASFRGTAASHTQVLWNGFAINSPMLGQVDFSYIPESFFDEVKLLFGGGSLEAQGGALGGAVLLNNFSGNKNKPLFHFNQSVGSFGAFNTSAGINWVKGRFTSETAAVLQTAQNDFKYYNNGVLPPEWMTQQNASFLNTGFQQHFSYRLNARNMIRVITWNQWNHRNIPPIMTNVYKGGDPQEYQDDFFSRNIIAWSWHRGENDLSSKIGCFYEDQHYYLKTTTQVDSSVVTLIDSKNKTSGYYWKTAYQRTFDNDWTLKTGFDLMHDRVNSNNYDTIQSRNTVSFYAKTEKRFFKKLTLDFLLRAEVTDGRFLPLMPLAGINFKLLDKEALFLRGTVSGNYHLPALNDLYWYPGGNPDLLPENGMEYDAGINYLKELNSHVTFSAELSAYYSLIRNWIQWKPTDYRFWTPENIGFVKSRGVEASLLINGYFKGIGYRFSAKYAYTKTTDESDLAEEGGYAGRQLIYIPLHHGNLFAYATFRGWTVSWNTIFTGARNTTTNPEEDFSGRLPYYSVNNVQVGKKVAVKRTVMHIHLKVNNFFNVQYQSVLWRAMPGIHYELAFRMDINR